MMMDEIEQKTYEDYYEPYYRAIMRHLFGWDDARVQAWIDSPVRHPSTWGEMSGLFFHEPPAYYVAIDLVPRGDVLQAHGFSHGEVMNLLEPLLTQLFEAVSMKPSDDAAILAIRRQLEDVFIRVGIDKTKWT